MAGPSRFPTRGVLPATPPADSDTTISFTTPSRIGTISVVGNVSVDSVRILRSFEILPGSRMSDETLRHGLRKLFALGLLEDVWLEKIPHGDTVDVVIHVKERPRISKIEFSGNKKREDSDLERKLILRSGSVYSPITVQTQIDSLLKYYREEGFAQAAIEAQVDTATADRQVALRFVIREGEKVKITHIRFTGATAFKEKKLRKQMKSKKKGFLGGGDVKEENFELDKEKLEAWYHNHGYRDMRVVGSKLEPGETARKLTLDVEIEEGPLYKFGTAEWIGNQVVGQPVLRRMWTLAPGAIYDASKVDKAQADTYAEYAEHGYLYVGVEPRENVTGEKVDVTFAISEGQPSQVRLVNISGNRGTREKVIRREISIHEGDRFKRSALVRTQGDIFRLGLFEDVQVDFSPADTTDVDINLKVKEKQVGTASAGAGYTSESGLTGFLELGHNNLLGNGQSLQLHLERGGKRSDYFLSFTEPWFRDTPTLLGFSLFNTSRDRDVYEEKRVGGSARIGRPLPWPDYSRGSLSYRLENVTIRALGDSLTTEDQVTLAGVPLGKPVLTSSVETAYSRNSANNPFYPTAGSRVTLNDEFAGGPFGGSVHFHKHRLEGKLYVRSLVKPVTTMLRGRFGWLGQYQDQNSAVPTYERFRLGGGTTIDPLRGYDDYQVVPDKFNRFIPDSTVIGRDTTVTGPDTTFSNIYRRFDTHVRYPGGRFMLTLSLEQQFPIMHPLHGLLFVDAGNTWDLWNEIKPWDLKVGAGVGFRFEIPLLGNIGFDYGYGFDRDDGPRWKGHFLIGNVNF